MSRLPVYILAGGRSSRFGSDKARASLHGQPLLARLADAVGSFAETVTVVADLPDKYDDMNLRTIADRLQDRGPLGGLHTALTDMPKPGRLLLLSCDILTLRRAWIDQLVAHTQRDAPIAAFRPDGRWQPLLAIYCTCIRPLVEYQLNDNDRSMQSLLNHAGTRTCPTPSDWPRILQANTPRQLHSATIHLR